MFKINCVAIIPRLILSSRGSTALYTVRARAVQIGRIDDKELIVTGGLRPGDRIVTSGLVLLTDGAKVKPLASRQPSRTTAAAAPAAAAAR